MEPISYKRAIIRRWPLIVVLAIVCAVVGVLIPIKVPYPAPQNEYQATALAGVQPPKGNTSGKGGSSSLAQVEYYAEQQQLYVQLAAALKMTKSDAIQLRRDITLKGKKGLPAGSTQVLAKQPTKSGAAKVANVFVHRLVDYINAALKASYNSELNSTNASVVSLGTQVQTLTQEVNAATPKPKKTTPTTTTTTTTTTTSTTTTSIPKKKKTTTSTTTPTTLGGAGTSQTTPTTTKTSDTTGATNPTTTSADPPTAITQAVLTATSGTTSTTLSQLSDLQQQLLAAQTEYKAALAKQAALKSSGPSTTTLQLLEPAKPNNSKFIPASSNPFWHRSVRAGAGFLAGVIIGIALAFLWDALDKRLRTSKRVTEVFGLPVLAEIPKNRTSRNRKASKRGAAPASVQSVAVVDEPASISAEAYRRLRVSMMFAPTPAALPVMEESDLDSHVDGHRAVSRNGLGADEPPGKRDVILVASPGNEPTEREVVTNLAAAYAEAGERVLVLTTTDLRVPGHFGSTSVPDTTGVHVQANEPPTEQVAATSGSEATAQMSAVRVDTHAQRGSSAGRGGVTVEEVAARCIPQRVSGVSKLQLGELLRGPGELATRGNAVIKTAREVADVVIVEAPAMLGTPDAEALVRCVDAVVVVAQCYKTTVAHAVRSSELLRRVAAPTLGVVLTGVELSASERKALANGTANRR